jgi:hypothetical protein
MNPLPEFNDDEPDMMKFGFPVRATFNRAKHFPSIQEQEQHWHDKKGFCLGCNALIAISDSYCGECESFLSEMYNKGDQ